MGIKNILFILLFFFLDGGILIAKASDLINKHGVKSRSDLIVESITDFPFLNNIPTNRVDATIMPIAVRNMSQSDTSNFKYSISSFHYTSCQVTDTLKVTFLPFAKANIYQVRIDYLQTQHMFRTINKTIVREKVTNHEKQDMGLKPIVTKKRETVLI